MLAKHPAEHVLLANSPPPQVVLRALIVFRVTFLQLVVHFVRLAQLERWKLDNVPLVKIVPLVSILQQQAAGLVQRVMPDLSLLQLAPQVVHYVYQVHIKLVLDKQYVIRVRLERTLMDLAY